MREPWIPVHYFEISNWRHVKNEEKCKWMKNNTSLWNFEVGNIHLKVGRNDKKLSQKMNLKILNWARPIRNYHS